MRNYILATAAAFFALTFITADAANAYVCHAEGTSGNRTWGRSANMSTAKGLALGRCTVKSGRCWIRYCE
jgi:hypothetical protein